MSDSVRPQRWQPTRLPRPWDSPGKNTGVGCHFLLQCMNVKSESEVAQSFPTLSDPMDCSLPGSSVHGFSRQEYWSGVPLPSPTTLPASWEICTQVKNQQLELDMDNGLLPDWKRSMSRLYLSSCLFNFYAQYIMWNAGLDEAQLKWRFLGEVTITSDM